jgi:murein DD-endopeptidase MepM/ murein hydrolase activator NlpD
MLVLSGLIAAGCEWRAKASDEQQPKVIAPAVKPQVDPAETGDVAALHRRGLRVPVQGMGTDSLIPSFDQERNGRVHEALDIIANRGTPVVAVENGTIAKLFTSKAGGLTVYQFDPSGRYAYYYAHLDAYADGLAEGQAVRGGQTLGYVGTSGNADPKAPHLHFAIFRLGPEKRWWKGEPIDPYAVFKGGVGAGTR